MEDGAEGACDVLVPASGRVWVGADPRVLFLAGEVDVAVVAQFTEDLGMKVEYLDYLTVARHLPDVREIDMSAVTFADSSAVGLISAFILLLQHEGHKLTVRGLPEQVVPVLEVTGVLPMVARVD